VATDSVASEAAPNEGVPYSTIGLALTPEYLTGAKLFSKHYVGIERNSKMREGKRQLMTSEPPLESSQTRSGTK